MARKAKLTPDQFAELERRHLIDGESIRSLAREAGIDEKTLRQRINPQSPRIKSDKDEPKSLILLASEKIEVDARAKSISAEIASLPAVRQATLNDLVSKVRNITNHMASGAEYSAATYHRLSALANQESAKIDDVDPLSNIEARQGIAAMQSLANEAAKIPLGLMNAQMKNSNLMQDSGADIEDIEVKNMPVLDAAKAYQDFISS